MTQLNAQNALLDAALRVIRQRGYESTTVDAICREAGFSKGSFFHYFSSKEELAIAAAAYFNAGADTIFGNAPYANFEDPRDRVFGYLELRRRMLEGEIADYTCLLGTMVQETYATHPRIRDACAAALDEHITMLTRDIELAKARYAPTAEWHARELAAFLQASIQGAFILAKAQSHAQVADDCLQHLARYVALLLPLPAAKE